MRFGQLQIFSPDGSLEIIVLQGDAVGIGRSPGNYLVLDRNGVSRYHVTLTVRDNEVYLEDLDSVNGTYVDGLPLKGHEPRLLQGGEEIQIADVRLVFQPVVDLDITVKTSTLSFEHDNVLLELEGPGMAVTPGAYVHAVLNITNRKSEPERFTLEIEGLPKGWARLDRRELEIPSNEKRDIRINFKPRRHSDSKPGEYDIIVRVTEQNAPQNVHELKSKLHVLKYGGYGVALGKKGIDGNTPFQMYIHNQGNAPLSLEFRGQSLEKNLQFVLNPPKLILGAGERQTVVGTITSLNRPLIGRPKEHRFDVISRALDASGFQAPLSGTYTETPLVPPWAVGGAAGALALLIAVILIIGLLVLPSDDSEDEAPTHTLIPIAITQFDVNVTDNEVTLGEPVFITWDTAGAELVSVVVANDNLEPATYALTGAFGAGQEIYIDAAGRYTLILTAQRGAEELTQEATVRVQPKLELTIEPEDEEVDNGDTAGELILYRNVEQKLRLGWNVQWTLVDGDLRSAPTVNLDSPPLDYTSQNVALASPPELITVRPTSLNPIDVKLVSSGPDGVQSSIQETIIVVDPVCTLTAPATDIFDGPGAIGYSLLYSSDPVSMRVDAQTENGAWVRVFLPPNAPVQRQAGWVLAEDLNCEFELANLGTTGVYPPPSFTPTPAPSATPIPIELNSPASEGTSTTTPPPQQG